MLPGVIYPLLCTFISILSHDIYVFRFPLNWNIRQKWLEILKQEDHKARVVCSQHFKMPEDYRILCDKRKLLKKDAIPSVNVPDMDVQCIRNGEP